jgi:Ca-activated chloride channel homolog
MNLLRNRNGRPRDAHGRKGAMLVLVAVGIMILMASAAFTVDLAYMFLATDQLQIGTDAACKAACTGLSQGYSTTKAATTAITCAGSNTICGQRMALASSNVIFGSVSYSSSGKWTFTKNGTPSTAVQVYSRASVPLFFGGLLGTPTFATSTSSTSAFLRNKICLVIDRSASMSFDMSGSDWSYPTGGDYDKKPASGSRWSYLRQSTSAFLTAVAAAPVENQVAMVSFSDSASTDVSFTKTYSNINNAIANYAKNPIYGGTNLASGIQAAINLFNSTDDGTPWNELIIIESDGQWNEGSNPTTLVSTLVNMGVVVDAVGLLNNDATLQSLASSTGGQFYYAANAAALTAAFQAIAQTIPVILIQ